MPEKKRQEQKNLYFSTACESAKAISLQDSTPAWLLGGKEGCRSNGHSPPFCWKPLQLPGSCSSGLVCARNTCLGWVAWLAPLWGLPGLPEASLRIWGLLFLVTLWWGLNSPCICTHRLGEYTVKPICETWQLQKSDMIVGYNRFLSDVVGHSDCAGSN